MAARKSTAELKRIASYYAKHGFTKTLAHTGVSDGVIYRAAKLYGNGTLEAQRVKKAQNAVASKGFHQKTTTLDALALLRRAKKLRDADGGPMTPSDAYVVLALEALEGRQ